MPKRCLMLRPRTQTSSPLVGRDAGMPCTTSCRVPPTPRDESCPSHCHCPSCTSTQEGEMETILRTARALPPPTGRGSRGTANLLPTPPRRQKVTGGFSAALPFVQNVLVSGG